MPSTDVSCYHPGMASIDLFEKTRRSGDRKRYRLSRAGQSYLRDTFRLLKIIVALVLIIGGSTYLATHLF